MTWQRVSKDSCQGTVRVDVTGIDVSITVTSGDLVLRSKMFHKSLAPAAA